MVDIASEPQSSHYIAPTGAVVDANELDWNPGYTYMEPFVLRGSVADGAIVHVSSLEISDGYWAASRGVVGLPIRTDDDVEGLFAELAPRWSSQTTFTSSLTELVMHPDYQRVIGLGFQALPLIMARMVETSEHWMWALKAITGEDPGAGCGRVSDAVTAWVDWFQRLGSGHGGLLGRLPELVSGDISADA